MSYAFSGSDDPRDFQEDESNPYRPSRFDTTPSAPLGSPYNRASTRQSLIGIASFVISLIVGMGEIGAIVIFTLIQANNPGAVKENSPEAVILGLLLLGGVFLAVVGGVLGIVSFFEKDRHRVFGILGLAFNALIVLGFGGLMVLGLIVQANR